MHAICLLTWAFLCGTGLLSSESVSAISLSDLVSGSLQVMITASIPPQGFVCKTGLPSEPNQLQRLYRDRGFRPAWSTEDGPREEAADLVKAIHEASLEGLQPEDYHLAPIEALLAKVRQDIAMDKTLEPEKLAELDLLLTDTLLLYGSHLAAGRVNPIRSEWFVKNPEVDLVETLETALDAGRIEETLEILRPQHHSYAGLKSALSQYQVIMRSGGWPAVPDGRQMRKGDRGPHVAALRSRLIVSGDLHESIDRNHSLFDEVLELGVRKFQKRHGLDVDGIVGPATLKALNVPAEDRVRQIKLNMERWRWLPRDFGPRYLLVNVANFRLDVVEDNHIVTTMRVVVGRRSRPTPVFSARVIYMELNPYWHIPLTIAKEDILPNLLKNPHYLIDENIRVFESWKANAPEVDPLSIEWSQITAKNLRYKLRQDPGPSNALGRIKFVFPNKFDVYLHDTPARALFEKTKRSSSSGCIRVEKPIELADHLLRHDPRWTRKRILTTMGSGKRQIILISEPITLYVIYLTAWVDDDGTVHFRDDIYGRDKMLNQVLNTKRTAS
jgi:murein L,D-transpeptidase YcbB/YkuD